MTEKMTQWLSKATQPIRHTIVKKLTPQIYKTAMTEELSSVPRPSVLYMQDQARNRQLNCVEIGVQNGINAENMLKTLNINKLFLVDPYGPYIDRGIILNYANLKQSMLQRLAEFQRKIQFINKTSDEAIKEIPDGLDFIYIDGSHEYSQVTWDICNYSQKLKKGGVLAGHDFYGDYLGVVKAVLEFASNTGLELTTKKADWWFTL